jgi:hypothetical protein
VNESTNREESEPVRLQSLGLITHVILSPATKNLFLHLAALLQRGRLAEQKQIFRLWLKMTKTGK